MNKNNFPQIGWRESKYSGELTSFGVNIKWTLLKKDLEDTYAQRAPTEKGNISKYVQKAVPNMGEGDFLLSVK